MEDTLRRMELRRTNYHNPRRRSTVESKIKAYTNIVKQLLVSGMILGIFLGIKAYQNPTTKFIISNIKTSITHEVNLKNTYLYMYKTIENLIKELNKDMGKQSIATPIQNEKNIELTNSQKSLDSAQEIQNTSIKEQASPTVSKINDKVQPMSVPVISSLEQMELDVVQIKQQHKFTIPVSGKITSGLGIRINPITRKQELHSGLDIEANKGVPIKSSLDGKVIFAGKSSTYGNYIKIQTDDLLIIYAHCSKLYVKTDERVKKGQKIAAVGSTGLSTGNHLHFEILKDGRIVDPDKLISVR